MPTIDIHTHFFPESWPDLAERFGTPDWPRIRHTEKGKAEVMLGDRFFRKIYSACWDPDLRLQEMDRDGIDIQIVSATPVLFSYERPVEHAREVAKIFNEAALEICARGKGRLKPLCQVPLQDIDAACAEVSRCMKAGHLGVHIGNHVGDKNLDDPGILTFLTHCANEGAAVFVHPWDMMARERMPKHMMQWTVGMPAETQLSIVSLLLSGAFDRLPRELRICFAHGGGSFAFLLGRLQNAWSHHEVARGVSKHSPRHYLDRFYLDSAVFDQGSLKMLVDTVGVDRVILGSDYPFPLGEERIGELIRTSSLAASAKSKLLGENAARFLALDSQSLKGAGGKQSAERTTAPGSAPVEVHSPQNGLTYSSYLKIPQLLELQEVQSDPPHHDESMFIIIHQTYELWFKELLHDLDGVVVSLRTAGERPSSRDEVYEAARLLRRCTEIMRVLVEQFTILETMLPTHFLAFRGKLEPASGFQSEQFREIEFLCGAKDEKMLKHHAPTPEAYAKLEKRLREPSLHDVFFGALRNLGLLKTSGGNEEQSRAERVGAIRDLYRDERHYRDWLDVCERLIEFDELVVGWRLRHIQMVERTIGMRIGTGGSAGSSYLRLTLDKKFFPELWEARTILVQPE